MKTLPAVISGVDHLRSPANSDGRGLEVGSESNPYTTPWPSTLTRKSEKYGRQVCTVAGSFSSAGIGKCAGFLRLLIAAPDASPAIAMLHSAYCTVQGSWQFAKLHVRKLRFIFRMTWRAHSGRPAVTCRGGPGSARDSYLRARFSNPALGRTAFGLSGSRPKILSAHVAL